MRIPSTILAPIILSALGLQGLVAQPVRYRMLLTSSELVTLNAVEATEHPSWNQIQRLTELLQTDSGILALLRENPLLAERYTDASYFVDFVRPWRERIPVLPEGPGFLAEDGSTWDMVSNGSEPSVAITFHHRVPENAITIMTIRWENQRISSLSFMRGFENILPGRRERWRDHWRNRP